MRAIEFHGDERLELVERPDPTPGEGELLIAPTAVGICGTDVEIFEGSLAYFRMGIAEYPIVPGHEWTGDGRRRRRGRHRLRAGRPRRGGGGDRLRRVRALPRRPAAPVRAAHRDRHRPHGRRDGVADGLPGRVRAPRRRSSARRRAGRADVGRAARRPPRARRAASACWSSAPGPIGLLVAQCAPAEGAASVRRSPTRRADRLDARRGAGLSRGATSRSPATTDAIDVAILCAGGPAAIPSAFAAVRPGGTVVALGLSGSPTIPFDFDGLVVRDIDLIGVLGSVGYWPGAIELIATGRVKTEPLVTATFRLERTRDALEQLVDPGIAEGPDRALSLRP